MKLYDANGRQTEVDTAIFGMPPTAAIALKYNDPTEDARWITDERELAKLRQQDAPLAYVASPGDDIVANCTGCGDPVSRKDATWHDGECYCAGCENAPAEV